MTVLNSFDSTHPDYLAGIFESIKTLWEGVNSDYATNTAVIFDIPTTILTHFSQASAALSGSLGSSAIVVYGSDPTTTTYSLYPANNLNFGMITQALMTDQSEAGINIDTATMVAATGQLSPFVKTLTNCVLGS